MSSVVEDVAVGKLDREGAPAIILRSEEHVLPIEVPPRKAKEVEAALTGKSFKRPRTNELVTQIFTDVSGEFGHARITDVDDDRFYAVITLRTDGHYHRYDAQASDAVALATHFESPVYIGRLVIEQAAIERSNTRLVEVGGENETTDDGRQNATEFQGELQPPVDS